MSVFLDRMIERAKLRERTIVLPESNDERILSAAEKALEIGLAHIILIGNTDEILSSGYNLQDATIIDPANSEYTEEFIESLYELRKKKGVSREDARHLLENNLYYGVMLVKKGIANGMVAGACNSTANVLRPSLQILKTKPGTMLVSSYFIMIVPDCTMGDNGTLLFSDCGLEVQPDEEKLAHIALSAAESWKSIIGTEPRVAMLSHSTYGSSKKEEAIKVFEATRLAKRLAPDLLIDGEIQLDAALITSIGQRKAPGSPVAGNANVLIFPDIDAGNIGYKLVQRLANAEAYGPITQGLAAPVNDLSRGCTAEDVLGVIAITCNQD